MQKIELCMKRVVFSIAHSESLAQAARLFAEKRIGLLPVVDDQGHLLGVLGLRDLVEMALPDFLHLLKNIDFIQDFGAVEAGQPGAATLAQPVTRFMKAAISVRQESGLLRAYALMLEHDLHDLPVVDEHNRLVGIASRVDLGVAVVSRWVSQA